MIDLSARRGLEFGPLASPFVRRDDGPIHYVDHASTLELRDKYRGHGWDTSSIVDVDTVLDARPFAERFGRDRFDYAIASHVIEHVPDVIGWLLEIESVLSEDGIISLVIPDKRYCFDVKRPPSTTGELLEASLFKRKSASAAQVFDFWARYTSVDTTALWRGASTEHLPNSGTLENAFERTKSVISSTAYADVHCWVFTPHSFLECLADLTELGVLKFELHHFVDTAMNELEFFVQLRCCSQNRRDTAEFSRAAALRFRERAGQTVAQTSPPSPVVSASTEDSPRGPAYRMAAQVGKKLVPSLAPTVGHLVRSLLKKNSR